MARTIYSNPQHRRLYICDRLKCDNCADGCEYTSDITHALYDDHPEHLFTAGEYGYLYERRRRK